MEDPGKQRKPKQQSMTQPPLNSERGLETPATEGVVELFKKEMRNKIAQEAAAFVMKKALEQLPSLNASVV